MIYNEDSMDDVRNILTYINDFTKASGFTGIQVESNLVYEVCLKMRQEFPHHDGLIHASTFKKVANFVAWFICCSPIKTSFPSNSIVGLNGQYNANAVVAFDIAVLCLEKSTIQTKDGDKTVSKQIYVSDHSYADIIDALSQPGLTATSHYHLLAVFFEQLTYKSNPHCEYGPSSGTANLYYPPMPLHSDDMTGI